ncbi:thiol-disulfide oxidoreductase [Candidatus Nanopelagicaceae bacterium]
MKKTTAFLSALLIAACAAVVAQPSAQALSKATFASNNTKLTFTAKTVEGKKFSSKVLANKKPTVIWFWAPWCAICKNESANLVAAAEQYKGKVNFVGIGALGNQAEMLDFVTHAGTSVFTNLYDGDGKLWNRFGVVIQPTLVFIDAKGKITSKVGPSDEEFLQKKLVALTAKK